jgi:two-component system OmpR family sensor kinase
VIHSIQGRIVVGSVAIAVVVLAILGVVVAEQLRHVAGEAVVTLAQEELRPFAADLRNQPGEPPDAPAPGTFVLVVAPSGDTVVDSLPPGLTAPVRRSSSGISRIHVGGGSYVAVGEVIPNSQGRWRLWAIRSSAAATLTLQGFARVLLLGVPVVLLLVALGSWLLVRAALRPVRRLRTAADAIQRSGVPAQLPGGRGRDELAALAATLNRFLEAQHEGVERERRMVADASHELRTPLAVLTMQLERGRHQSEDAAALAETVREAQAQVRAISRLTTQLLELSQLASDASDADRFGASVGDLLTEAMAGVDRARTIAPEGVQVDLDVVGVLHEGTSTRLSTMAFGRIVDNLMSNALRATSAGAVDLRIAESAGRLVLTVEDSGSGVPVGFLAHAFERFARSEESRATRTEGSGLGLALVRALVEDAGGRVALANRDEGGAIATVEIPLDAPPSRTPGARTQGT